MTLLLLRKDPIYTWNASLGCKAENHVSIAKMCTEIYSYFISPKKGFQNDLKRLAEYPESIH